VWLGLLPAPRPGVHDIMALYLARFRAPRPNERVFICVGHHRHGWQSVPQDLSAIVPPMPAPPSQPAPNGQFPIHNSQFSIGPRRFPSSILHPLSSILAGCGSAAPQCNTRKSRPLSKTSCVRAKAYPNASPSILHPPSSILFGCSLLPPGTHHAHPQCTRGTLPLHSPAPDLDLNRLCQRRKSRCRELWRGT